jgi:hypothetical protein
MLILVIKIELPIYGSSIFILLASSTNAPFNLSEVTQIVMSYYKGRLVFIISISLSEFSDEILSDNLAPATIGAH